MAKDTRSWLKMPDLCMWSFFGNLLCLTGTYWDFACYCLTPLTKELQCLRGNMVLFFASSRWFPSVPMSIFVQEFDGDISQFLKKHCPSLSCSKPNWQLLQHLYFLWPFGVKSDEITKSQVPVQWQRPMISFAGALQGQTPGERFRRQICVHVDACVVWLCMWGTALLHTCWESVIGTWTTSWSRRTYSVYLRFDIGVLVHAVRFAKNAAEQILQIAGWTLLSHRFWFCPWWRSKAWSAIGESSILKATNDQKPSKDCILWIIVILCSVLSCTQFTVCVFLSCRTCLGCSFDAWESSVQVEGTVNYSDSKYGSLLNNSQCLSFVSHRFSIIIPVLHSFE